MTQKSGQDARNVQHQSHDALWLRLLKGIWFLLALFGRVFRILLIVVLVLGVLAGIVYAMQLDGQVKAQFEGKRWALPARVFARPLDMYQGQQLYAEHLEQELRLLNYRSVKKPAETGQYNRKGNSFFINTRGFQFADDKEPARSIKLKISKGKVRSLGFANGKDPLALMRLEPVLIGNFYPRHGEDRVLVRIKDVSPLLINGLLSVEDKKFYEHQGVNPMAIARAMVANLKAGHTVQGGSTITQQLVKNFYLSNERSIQRKLKEAMMAFLLELHYDKQEILEAYLNEIHLGQDGDRAIHGFGLAAQFYFNRPVRELKSDQIALLIALVKGSSAYDPRRFPERAKARRDLVLSIMQQEGVLTAAEAEEARARPLGVRAKKPSGATPFPAYLDLVRQQLKRDYREEDLRSEGLHIFTSMDPILQLNAERVLVNRVKKLERAHRISRGKLNGAMVISSIQGGEVVALVGGRNVRYPGYNRALTAQRQIGSLVKPAIYLAALDSGKKYTLASRIDDGPVTVKVGRKYWKPGNYDHRHIGYVTMMKAITHSRNTPAVRVGVSTGVEKVIQLMNSMGVKKSIPAYPSILLGAVEMAPFDVQQMYHTIAAGGSYSPLKAIRKVMNSDGDILTRYPLTVEQVAKPESAALIQYAMNQVTEVGTARSLKKVLPGWKKVAGKTGTTNDKKDSWFAGFSGQHVMTVWVGRDDNKPTRMTGGTGALKVWGDMMKVLPSKPLNVNNRRLVWVDVDKNTGQRFNSSCGEAVRWPFARGTQPRKTSYCAPPQPIIQDVPTLPMPAQQGNRAAPARVAPVVRPAPAPRPVPRPAPAQQQRDPSSWFDELMQ